MMKRVCALLMALVLVLSASAALADEAADALLVTVNGQEIRENDEGLKFWINYLYSQITEGTEVDQATVNQYAMDYAIRYTLLDQELNRQGLSMTEEETAQYTESAKTTWETAITSIMQSEYGITDESSEEDRSAARADAIDYIKVNYGYTEESYIAEELEYYHLSTLSTKFTEIMSADIVVSDEDVQAVFDEEVEQHKAAINDDAGAYEFYTNYYGYNLLYKPEGYRGIFQVRWHILEPDKVYTSTFPMAVDNNGCFYEFVPIPRKVYRQAVRILKDCASYKNARRRILYLVKKELKEENSKTD